MNDIFELYKPLRNQIKRYTIEDSFFVIWAYYNYIQNNIPLPENIEEYTKMKYSAFKNIYVHEDELEFLLKEIIINCESTNYKQYSLKSFHEFKNTLNKLRDFDNKVYNSFGNKENVLYEMNRRCHSQFPWQAGIDKTKVIRFFNIYSSKEMDEIILNKYGLTYSEILALGLLFIFKFEQVYALHLPLECQSKYMATKIDLFLEKFMKTFSQIKIELLEQRKYNQNIIYEFNPMKEFPLINFNNKLFLPLSLILFWGITEAVYYNIFDAPGFSKIYGDNFQKYIGKYISALIKDKKFSLYGEQKYTIKKGFTKNSIDWIVEDEFDYFFIECKAKRLSKNSKKELLIDIDEDNDSKIIGDSIIQVYKTIYDFINDRYEHLKFNKTKNIFAAVVLLDELNFYFVSKKDAVYNYVLEKMNESLQHLLPLYNNYRCIFISSYDFELLVQKMAVTSINKVLKLYTNYNQEDDLEIERKLILEDDFNEIRKNINDVSARMFAKDKQ